MAAYFAEPEKNLMSEDKSVKKTVETTGLRSQRTAAVRHLHRAQQLKLRAADRACTERRAIVVGVSVLPLTGLMSEDPQEPVGQLI